MSRTRSKTKEEFIQDAKKVWGNQYDYSGVDYVNSKTKVLIRCIKHDETFLQTPFAHIIMKRQGCPICQEIRKNNMKHKKLLPIVKYDNYIKDWDYEKNKDHNPNSLTAGSSCKVWWKCSVCGHSWQAAPNRMRLQGLNCPICSLRNVNTERIKKKGSFADNYPERAKDWDYEKNGELLPTQVTAGSNIEVYWKCHVCGNEWKTMVVTHAKAKYSCKKCANKERPLKRFGNKPLVETHPQLAEEWDYKNNGELTPYNVTAHLYKRVNWVCYKGHHWPAIVSVRANLNVGCPHCKKELGTSFPEQAIYFYLRKVTNAQNRYIFKGEEIDIYLGDKEWNTAIEYDGAYYHSTLKSQNREKKKNQILVDNGIRLIRIKEGDYNIVSDGIIYYWCPIKN